MTINTSSIELLWNLRYQPYITFTDHELNMKPMILKLNWNRLLMKGIQ